ncbi:MAG TPA: hypothetical protein EYM37_00720 [Methylophaga aminisulfidivorans]|uniref:hypothetical protein n=1 Tax=Methylophaga TaxID=40222 RepID=UPI001777C7D7|nr:MULTISPECIES: hypothetical protein [Methylophaga]HIC46462.1 hypothetical protein [Methylophaga sp.]HIM38440.1 hypothetical protein [Methylophaga aminisulfidivorans]
MKWHFPRVSKDQVETEITQRDQFDNDELQLSETIVREAIQNSLDAALNEDETVKVTFTFLDMSSGLQQGFMEKLLSEQQEHARASRLDLTAFDPLNPSALVIEDFGTKGLTGSVRKKDNDNFTDFWRRHGKSHKSGKNRGRWGLGKLVYSCTSQARVFFGLTKRQQDESYHLMGQTVLDLHTIDNIDYTPHAFFCDLEKEDDPLEQFPIPVQDKAFVDEFVKYFGLERGGNSGLSIVIPYPNNLNSDRMIGITIQNYFYPIITKKLEVRINTTHISSSNIRELAHKHAHEHFSQIDTLFDFIEEASSRDPAKLLRMKESWTKDEKLDEGDFEPEVLAEIREQFTNGELVSLHMPISIIKKDATSYSTGFSIFIKRPTDLDKGLDLYVRGGLTLPSETKFRERRALGVLVAEEEPICAFLGDAENAAHTLWTTNTEKLRKNYQSSQRSVTMIKKALVQLYDLLADVTEEKDENALNQFFWFHEPEKTAKKKRPRVPKPPKPIIINRSKPKFTVNRVSGGLILKQGEGLTDGDLPRKVSLKLAYEVSRGNAFKKWSPYDFDTGKNKEINKLVSGGVDIDSAGGQDIVFNITSIPFYIEVSGFDTNRDLKIRVV